MTDAAAPTDLEGRAIGPVSVAVTADRVALYIDVTDDDPARWSHAAPPGFGSVLLFAVADEFLYDSQIAPFTKTLLHLDQSFTYLAPIEVGSSLIVTGEVKRVRQRGDSYFVTFTCRAESQDVTVMEAVSTFVLSDHAAPPADSPIDEPHVHERGINDGPDRSASRHDLVRYSAATRDFNPLHWDHNFAVEAGLPGTVVHGLLMYAWIAQEVSRVTNGGDVKDVKIRFRSALMPGQQATISAEVDDERVKLTLSAGGEQLVTGTATVGNPTE